MAMARIDPSNRTGTGGVDPLSNNYNWILEIVGLKGRGGLDLGLSLAYNSLATYTKSGNDIAFDMDQGTPSPGFRLGFPTVQGPYTNNLTGTNFYMLITPSGGHQELRQISTNVYQAVDASYSQLTYYDNGTNNTSVDDYLIYRAGGAQLKFYLNPTNTEWHCTEVKDRNGNFLTVNYQGTDDIQTVTDTLSRTITFVYDGNVNIKEIDQTWNGQVYQWATFGWGPTPIGNSFSSSLNYAGPDPGTTIQVVKQVGLPDGSKYCFEYDGSFGVIKKIHYYAPDDDDEPNGVRHERRRTTYNFNFTNNDSPRVTSERTWAENWNGDTDGAWASSEEAVTQFGNTTAPPPTFNGYTYRRNLSIDHTKVPNTDQSNFPMLVSGTYSYLKTTANGGSVQNANGYDVIFTSDSSCATKLNHETETYNASTGAVNYWVKAPTVSHTSDTTL